MLNETKKQVVNAFIQANRLNIIDITNRTILEYEKIDQKVFTYFGDNFLNNEKFYQYAQELAIEKAKEIMSNFSNEKEFISLTSSFKQKLNDCMKEILFSTYERLENEKIEILRKEFRRYLNLD